MNSICLAEKSAWFGILAQKVNNQPVWVNNSKTEIGLSTVHKNIAEKKGGYAKKISMRIVNNKLYIQIIRGFCIKA